MSTLEIKLSMDPDGCLYPDPAGVGKCTVTFSLNPALEKVATIFFAGYNQAFLTFDTTGTRVVSHTLYQVTPDRETQISVNNIINYLNGETIV